MGQTKQLSVGQLAVLLRSAQRQSWWRGQRLLVESYLIDHPLLSSNQQLLLDLIYSEFCLRDEFGEKPEPEEYYRRFPEFTDQLTPLFEMRLALESSPLQELVNACLPHSQAETASVELPETIDDVAQTTARNNPLEPAAEWPSLEGYEILGELGRGAMGVVYRARQLALKRTVALKMILAGAQAGPDQLARFQTEAEAVAQLQHPNIVQIFEVGKQAGLPYFSLEFVDGKSLTRHCDRQPQSPEQSAHMVQTLARAMHYAHQQGIIHRDLKPVNVLLTRDGVPKITDFGLAKRFEGGSHQTRTGAVMGTPSYMAPEQAIGDHESIGPLSDVYALGAILYDMLTGRPPFLGQTPVDTMMQVRRDEPVQPTQLQPTVPRDLETICMKCLQKEPDQRYVSAEALAEDLRRFSANEPILARPVGPAARLARWCKRNPRTAWSGGVAACLALILAVGGPVAALSIAKQRDEAVVARREADRNAAAARAAQLNAQKNARAARHAESQAEDNARVATEQTSLALSSIRTMVYEIQKRLSDREGMQTLKQNLLKPALSGLDQVASKFEDSRRIDRTRARTHQLMADIYSEVGSTQQALHQHEQAHEVVLALASANPDDPILAKRNPAITHLKLGDLSLALGQSEAALEHFRQTLQLRLEWAEMQPEDPGARESLVNAAKKLGRTYIVLGNPQEALRFYSRSVELIRQWIADQPASGKARRELAGAYMEFGDMSLQFGDIEQAQCHYSNAVREFEALMDPESRADRWNLALAHTKWGDASLMANDLASAVQQYSTAVDALRALTEAAPKNARAKRDLSIAYYGLGTAKLRMHDADGAARAYAECLALREALTLADPDNVRWQIDYMLALARCGEHAEAAKIADVLRAGAPEDSRVLYHSACCYALCASAAAHDGSSNDVDRSSNENLHNQYVANACETLERAIEHGFSAFGMIQIDPDLEPIRHHSRFIRLVEQLTPSRREQ